jgi:predicted RNA-binding protein with PUA domain
MVRERERQHKVRKIQERVWESSEEEEDVTAIGLIQGSANSESDESEDDEVIVSEGEELEQADELAFGRLMASAVEESRCVLFPKCPIT